MAGSDDTPRAFGAGQLLLTVAAIIVVIAGLRAAEPILIPFLIATVLAVLAAPPVDWLKRHRLPTPVAILLVVVVILLVISAFGAVVGSSVNEFTEAVPRYKLRLEALETSISGWVSSLPIEMPSVKFLDVVDPGQLMDLLGRGLSAVLATLSNTLLVVLTLVFMLLEAASFPAKSRLILGRGGEAGRFSAVTTQVQQYLAIKTAVSLVTGVLAGSWVAILGLDFALLWGVVAFLLNYIPTLGSIFAAAPAVLLALVQLGPARAVAVALGYVAINMVLGNLVEPALMGRRLGLSTLVVFLSLVFWGWLWGPVGMLLSVPLTMMVKILLENSDDLRWVAIMLDSRRAAEAKVLALESASPEPSARD